MVFPVEIRFPVLNGKNHVPVTPAGWGPPPAPALSATLPAKSKIPQHPCPCGDHTYTVVNCDGMVTRLRPHGLNSLVAELDGDSPSSLAATMAVFENEPRIRHVTAFS